MNQESDNTSPETDLISMIASEEYNAITTNQNPSPAAFTTALTTNSYFLAAVSSAAVGDNNLSSTCSRKRAFVPADPALGGWGAEMGSKKAKKE
jgi:hypothetical protein